MTAIHGRVERHDQNRVKARLHYLETPTGGVGFRTVIGGDEVEITMSAAEAVDHALRVLMSVRTEAITPDRQAEAKRTLDRLVSAAAAKSDILLMDPPITGKQTIDSMEKAVREFTRGDQVAS